MDDYQQSIRILSDRIVLAQTPIRVLDAVKWDDSIRQRFLKAKGKELPAVDRDYYLNRPLSFDSSKVKLEFQNIERDITRQLGQFNPVGQIMRRMCKEYRMVVRMLEARGIEYNRLNRDQALVPACCTVLFNAHGTAPGMWFEQNGKVVVSLPGVPFEMEHLMTDEVMPRLKARFSLRQIVHRTLITAGLAESMLAEKIADWENALPPYLHLAYLPAPGVVRLRLSAYEVEGESVSHEIDRQFAALQRIIPRYVLGFERATMQEIVHNLLTQRRQTLATAESCTGGSIAARFTAMPGASAYFLCGVVAYSNESKNNLLGVDPETIASRGAVSEEVARQMAEGARRITGADYAVATTGIAGPAGGTEQKPVGTVWMAVAGPHRTVTLLKQCGTDRGQVIDRASAFALALLRDEIERDAAGE